MAIEQRGEVLSDDPGRAEDADIEPSA